MIDNTLYTFYGNFFRNYIINKELNEEWDEINSEIWHMVQAGVGPFAGPPGFPGAQAAGHADALSVAVAVKADHMSQLKPDGSQPQQTTVSQVYMHKKITQQTAGQFSPSVLGPPPQTNTVVPTSGQPTLTLPSLSLPVVPSVSAGAEQQTVSLTDLLQQKEPEPTNAQQQQQQQQQLTGNFGTVVTNTPTCTATSIGISNSVTTPTPTINAIASMNEPVGGGGASAVVGVVVPSIATSSVASQTTSQIMASASATGIITSAVTTAPASTISSAVVSSEQKNQPKRLHVSNIPFRFRDPDLRAMFGQFGTILDVEIIFNERGSKGFGFVTFANSSDAERARERLHGTVVEGRKIEVNNATARVQTKKAPTVPNVCVQWPEGYRLPVTWPFLSAIGTSALNPTAQTAPTQIAPTAPLVLTPRPAQRRSVYYDPFLAAAAATADPNYRFQATAPLLKTPLSTAQQAFTAAATYTAVAARAAYGAAAAAQPAVAQYATVAGYGREYPDPYLGHGIGPVPGYGAAMYRGGYNRFAPY